MSFSSPKTIFLIDDHDHKTELIVNAFSSYPESYQLLIFHGLNELAQAEVKPDIVIACLKSTNRDDWNQWKDKLNHIPILFLTESTDSNCADEKMSSSIYWYIPYSVDTLINIPQMIDQCLLEWKMNQSILDRREKLVWTESFEQNILPNKEILYQLDRHGNIVYISSVIEQYGYSPEQLLGTHIYTLIHPNDREKVKYKVCERRNSSRDHQSFECRLLLNNTSQQESQNSGYEEIHCRVLAKGLYSSAFPSANHFIGTQGIICEISHIRHQYSMVACV